MGFSDDYFKKQREIDDARRTGAGDPFGQILHDLDKKNERLQKQREDDDFERRVAAQEAERQQKELLEQAAKYRNQTSTVAKAPRTDVEDPGLSWLDKVVFYAAFLFGVIGFGLGFAATSSLESWWPLVGAGFGAAIGLAIPIAIAALVAKAVYFVKHNWAGIVLVAIVAGGAGIAYLVLSAP